MRLGRARVPGSTWHVSLGSLGLEKHMSWEGRVLGSVCPGKHIYLVKRVSW